MKIRNIDKAGLARRAAEKFTRRNETLAKVKTIISDDEFISAKAKTDARNSKDVAANPGIGRFLKAMGSIKTHQAPFTPPTEEIKPIAGLVDLKSFFE